MTVEAARDAPSAPESPMPARAVAFDGLFGWFSPGVTRRGVVLCGTLGFEQLSAYRAWRALARDIAATGCATLRFDYPGEGDSGDAGAGRVAGLVAAIHRAVSYLREEAEADEIVLVGLRLGGTLAALAARECGVDRLVLLAPFATGRAYLREMALRSRTIDQLPNGTPFPQEPDAPIVGGFRLAPGLVADLAAVKLLAAERAPAPRILLLGPDPAGLAARYAALGSAVATGPFPGLAPLVANALFAEAPRETFAAAAAFAAEGARPRPSSLRPPAPPARLGGAAWDEEPVEAGDVFGILCRPREPAPGGEAVLFLNSGLNARSGYGRQTTDLARRLAAEGVTSLRVDLCGVGDSADRPDGTVPLYALDALDDVTAALDRLDGWATGPLTVVGSCSGAHLGFHALCRDARIRAAVLINLYCFDWNSADDVRLVLKKPFRSAATYASLLRQRAAWRRLLRGEVRAGAILGRLARTGAERLRRQADRLFRAGGRAGTVPGRIAALRRRGADLHLVYSAGETGLAEVRAHLGRTPAQVARCLGRPVTVLGQTDHNLSTIGAQDRLAEIVRAAVSGTRARPA